MEIHIIEVGHCPLTIDTQMCPKTYMEKEYNTSNRFPTKMVGNPSQARKISIVW